MEKLIIDYFDEIVSKYPNKVAIEDGNSRMTFKEVHNAVLRIATKILANKIFKKPIAIYSEQNTFSVVAILAVIYSGNFYTIIDSKSPTDRIKSILDNLKPEALIVNKKDKKLEKVAFYNFKEVFSLSEEDIDEDLINSYKKNITIDDLLYVLYTSGSTGKPKGVMIGQRSVINYTNWVTATFKIDISTCIGNQAPFYFDNSVLDIYQMIFTGATLYIIPHMLFSFPIKLLEYISKNKINTIFWVPTALCYIANLKALELCDVSCLKKILFAGEVMPVKQLNYWRKYLPNAIFVNLYGPTEITVDCTYFIVNRDFKDNDSLPIGFECKRNTVYLLDEKNEIISDCNKKGEICVLGPSLSYGYYNDIDKTKKAFINILINDKSERVYKTGDIGFYNINRELMYAGRIDNQIKFQGHRIELGEIENQASAINEVERVCCIFLEDKKKIVMVYSGEVQKNKIIQFLRKHLPDYMIPKDYLRKDKLPMNANGKIDRLKLKRELMEQ